MILCINRRCQFGSLSNQQFLEELFVKERCQLLSLIFALLWKIYLRICISDFGIFFAIREQSESFHDSVIFPPEEKFCCN